MASYSMQWSAGKFFDEYQLLEKYDDFPIVKSSNFKTFSGKPYSFTPFKWSSDGFIIQRVNNQIHRLAIDGVHCRHDDPDLKFPPKSKGRKFCVVVKRVNSTNSTLVCFFNPLLALAYAWQAQKLDHRSTLRLYSDLVLKEDRVVRILEPIVNYLEDKEYNTLTGTPAPTESPVFDDLEYRDTITEAPCDDTIYGWFRTFMVDSIRASDCSNIKWGGSSCVGTVEALVGEEMMTRNSKKNLDFNYVSYCADFHGVPAIVTRFPKSGTVTSSGKIRSIYPMNVLYENFLRRFFGKCIPRVPYKIASGRDFGKPMKRFYDVRSCDKQLLPYLARFCREYDCDWMIPKVNDPHNADKTRCSYINQFPSGVLHTTLVTVCFTAALMKSKNIANGVIQGDGFMCDEELSDPILREEDSFNGFKWDSNSSQWRYSRCHRLTEFKYERGSGPTGKMRYYITAWAYKQLGGEFDEIPIEKECWNNRSDEACSKCGECGMLRWYGTHWNRVDDYIKCQLVSRTYQDAGRIVKMVLNEKLGYHDTRTNSWESAPTHVHYKYVPQGKPNLFNRRQIRPEEERKKFLDHA